MNENKGHGHVFKRPDGARMRCGGPSMCKECSADAALKAQGKAVKDKLLAHCVKFIADQNITCAETVSQSDRVIVNAYEFIEGVCEIVGYAKNPDEVTL